MENFGIAFVLTLLAGLATGIGSAIAFLAKRANYRFLSVSTGFSAGVMLYVSFVEIFQEAVGDLSNQFPDRVAYLYATLGFFGGIALASLIDHFVPSEENPHETHVTTAEIEAVKGREEQRLKDMKLHRMGLFTALAIGIHNFPEGAATFIAGLKDPTLGFAIAIAIALHNIPEGVSVSVPIFYATGDRKKAFLYSFLSGLAEPIGALVTIAILRAMAGPLDQGLPPLASGLIFSSIAGIMVYISLDELLPTSRAYGKGHDSLIGLVSGMAVMAASLVMMR